MEKEKCQYWDKCAAPLCPEDQASLEDRWFPEEEICKTHQDSFIKIQRKIADKAGDKTTYFTFDMLNRNCIIAKGILGIDPDCKNEKLAIEKWLKKHKAKRVMSEERRKQLVENMKNVRSLKKLNSGSVTSQENDRKAAF